MEPIFYDTETTGVRNDKDRIVEIAAYNPQTKESFVKLVKPGIPIPPEASAIHKITDEMVENAGTFKEVGQEFIDFCGPQAVLIAHNNDAFYKLFLDNEFKRHGHTPHPWQHLDSLKWARRYRPDLPRHSLQFLREVYGLEANNAHRALDDVIILHKVFSFMTDDLPIKTVVELMLRPTNVTHMPFGKYQGKPLSDVPADYVRWMKENGAFDRPENGELKSKFEALGLLK